MRSVFLVIFFTFFSLPLQAEDDQKETLPAPSGATGSYQEFLIGPEDVLSVEVWKNEDLSREVTVRPDGKISLPLIGEIFVQGLTTAQLEDLLTRRFQEFAITAKVMVSFRAVNSFKIYVMGKVGHPGMFIVRANTTVLQSLAMAGSFTPYAKVKKIMVFRTENGKQEIIPFNYKAVISGKDGHKDLLLRSGDVVVVP